MARTLRYWISNAFNTSIIEKNRHVWVDYLRGIVIILVVYHHAFLGLAKSGIDVPRSVVDANMAAYSFRMPLFFIFSGIFTSLGLYYKPVNEIIKSKFNLLLYPYVIWSAIQITLQIVFSAYTNSTGNFTEYLYILYQPKRLAHFWYLPALFNSTIVFVLIKSKFKIKPWNHLLLGITLFLAAPFVNEISMMSNWMRFYIFLVIGEILSSFILKKENQKQIRKGWYFLASIPFFILAQYYYFNVIGVRSLENESAGLHVNFLVYTIRELGFLMISLVGCATFILLSFLIEKWNRLKWLRIVGFHSLYIYIMHVIVVGFSRAVFHKVLGVDNYVVLLLTAIFLGVTIPIIFYNLVGKKYLWFLFSTKKIEEGEKPKAKEPNVRSSELRIPPLHSPVNNI
ncbi:MAG TPA: acyltransferase [Flavisolibacter sp.]|jgi:fucose 4-O-acetylase-like acetyltransferase|nr:acyltransferase [Flavisolibacter sp.]